MSTFNAIVDQDKHADVFGLSEAAASGWIGLSGDVLHEAVLSAAILTSAAFRMRDDGALIAALRGLASAVAEFELSCSNDND